MLRRRGLHHRELGHPAVAVQHEVRPQRVHPGGFQPFLGPAGQLPAGGLLQRGQQVGQRRVAPGVLAEVQPHPGQELLPADVGDQLLEHRRALGVRDAVEVDLDRGDVRDVGRDRVRGRQLVLLVGPGLLQLAERGPGVDPPGGVGLGQHGRPGGERLVQPQVVPPAHGDQVAEPHVRHLVQDRLGPHLPGEIGYPGAEHVVLQERDAARVLHRAGLELRHEHLVVLAERVPGAERGVVEVEALAGHLEDLVRVQVPGQRLAAVQAQRDAVVFAADLVVRPGHDRGDVGGHQRRGREMPAPGRAVRLAGHIGRRVGQHQPVRRGEHRKLECGLQVRLVEAGVDPVRVERLQVRVQVHAAVGRVGEPVQPLAAARVGAVGHHPQLVLRGQPSQLDPVAVERAGRHRRAVEHDLPDRGRGQLDEAGRAGGGAAEPHDGGRAERFRAPGEIELHLVGDDFQQLPPVPGFVTGEIVRHLPGTFHVWVLHRFCRTGFGRLWRSGARTASRGGMRPAVGQLSAGESGAPPRARSQREVNQPPDFVKEPHDRAGAYPGRFLV